MMLIIPEKMTDFIGLAILIGIFVWEKYRKPAEVANITL